MKAECVFQYGSPEVIRGVEIPRPEPAEGQVRVRVKAAGVGPWDALIRGGQSGIPQTLPLTLGSDIAGTVDAVGTDVREFRVGNEVYGLTNQQFVGGYAEYALASSRMIAAKPKNLNFVEAASAPVVAVTAWQMLFDYADAQRGQKVLIHGGAGNVGAYAVQLAKNAGLEVIATASSRDSEYVRRLGADFVVDYSQGRFEDEVSAVDIVIDTVGGDARERSFGVMKRGGILVSVVSTPMPTEAAAKQGVRVVFFFVDVTTARLNRITGFFEDGKLVAQVGTVLKLEDARLAHEMLAGAPHARGKIVLTVEP
jgi:NADPH:quinone reductase-like Zn-dependent oxidoreductase